MRRVVVDWTDTVVILFGAFNVNGLAINESVKGHNTDFVKWSIS